MIPITIRRCATVVCCASLSLSGCDIIEIDGVGGHDCNYYWDNNWSSSQLKLDHTDPRSCPEGVQFDERVTSGGRIIDQSADYPFERGDAERGYVDMFDDYDLSRWQGWMWIWGTNEMFQWGGSNGDTWQTELWVEYRASYNPDYGEFKVDLSSKSEMFDAYAVAELSYYGEEY